MRFMRASRLKQTVADPGGAIYDICPYMYMYEFNSISVVVLSRHC